MISASEGAAEVFVSEDLLALLLAFTVTSLLPDGCGAQAAARISKDTKAKIFFIFEAPFVLVTRASMPKTGLRQEKTTRESFRIQVESAVYGEAALSGETLAAGVVAVLGVDESPGPGVGDAVDVVLRTGTVDEAMTCHCPLRRTKVSTVRNSRM